MRIMAVLLVGFVFLAALTAGSGQTISQICPSRRYQLRQANATSFCYLYVQSPLSYAAANRSCVRDGAILLSIGSSDENAYIRSNFFVNGQEFWIGLNDILEEGTFRWENSSADDQLSYTSWSPAFPFDNRVSRDCVKFASDGWRVHNNPCGSSQLPFMCKSTSCSSSDGEVCLELVTMASPAALTDSGGVIAAVVIILLVVIAVVVVVVVLVCLWKFKNDLFNRFCCWCCGGAERSKVRNLQQENQRLRQQLSQHRLSVSGRMPPGQFSNALAWVPDGHGGLLPPIKQPVSPTTAESRLPFLASSTGGGGLPPLNIQRPQRSVPGPFIGSRPSVTAPAGGLPRGLFSGTAPIRPVRQSLPTFGSNLPQPMTTLGGSRGTAGEDKPVTPATLVEEDESESSEESEQEERAGPQTEGAESQADDKQESDKDSQQE